MRELRAVRTGELLRPLGLKVFGAHGEHVTKPAELEGALKRAFASGKPAIVDVMIDRKTLAPVIYKLT
jgi:acetolactate synthase-1/2/3 large subunit